jgi:hypothetical protein
MAGALRRSLGAALATGAMLAACSAPPPPALGVRRQAGALRGLTATADGGWLACLQGCSEARARSLPAGTASCDLLVVPAAGGDPVRVARAVTTLPGGVVASPAGAELASLAGYDYAGGAGTLVRWRAGEGARELASGVTFVGYGPDGSLGYIASGALFLAPPGGEPRAVAGVTAAASFDLAPPGGELLGLVRRRATAGGELLAIRPAAGGASPGAEAVAGPVGDYRFGRGRLFAYTRLAGDGARLELAAARPAARPEVVASGVRAFAFEPAGDAIAYQADAAPGKQGDLHLRVGGRDQLLGKEVGEFRWAGRASRLAWLEEYDPRIRSGALGAGGLDLPRRTLGKNVSDLELSPDGRYVAYLQHTTRGGYSVDLLLAALDAPAGAEPRRVAQASYGFGFSPDGRWLYYRTRCTRNGEACDLERLDASSAGAAPEKVAEGVKSFEFGPGDPGRLLLGWKRLDRDALDVGVWEAGAARTVDTMVLPGSARFLGPGAGRLAYLVVDEKRPGLYVADVPALPVAR